MCPICKKVLQKQDLSLNEYNCSLHVIFYTVLVSLHYVFFGSHGYPPLSAMNSTLISFRIILYSMYYIAIPVFQSRALNKQKEAEKRALEVKEMFMRYMSHEMRTPLNIVMSGLKFIEEDMRRRGDSEARLETIVDCHKTCGMAVQVLDEYLIYDKIEKGIYVIEKTEQSVSAFLMSVTTPFRVQAMEKGIDLRLPSLPNVIQGIPPNNRLVFDIDECKMSQVVRNLLSNAFKFTPRGGAVDVTMAYLAANENQEAGVVRVQVTDSGAGMSEEEYSQLFKAVIQFQPGRLQGGGGSGLGLYISKGIVDLHEGQISVWSAGHGFGSRFTIELPGRLIPDAEVGPLVLDNDTSEQHAEVQRMALEQPSFNAETAVYSVDQSSDTGGSLAREIRSPAMDDFSMSEQQTLSETLDLIGKQGLLVPARDPFMQEIHKGDTMDFVEANPDIFARESKSRLLARISVGPNENTIAAPNLRMLVVDDVDMNRKMMARLFQFRSNHCDQALDGLDAVTKVQQSMAAKTPYDLITMDYQMPNMDGGAATKRIRALGYTGLIIGVTGNVLLADQKRFMSQGLDAVLTKPFDLTDFDVILRNRFGSNLLE